MDHQPSTTHRHAQNNWISTLDRDFRHRHFSSPLGSDVPCSPRVGPTQCFDAWGPAGFRCFLRGPLQEPWETQIPKPPDSGTRDSGTLRFRNQRFRNLDDPDRNQISVRSVVLPGFVNSDITLYIACLDCCAAGAAGLKSARLPACLSVAIGLKEHGTF